MSESQEKGTRSSLARRLSAVAAAAAALLSQAPSSAAALDPIKSLLDEARTKSNIVDSGDQGQKRPPALVLKPSNGAEALLLSRPGGHGSHSSHSSHASHSSHYSGSGSSGGSGYAPTPTPRNPPTYAPTPRPAPSRPAPRNDPPPEQEPPKQDAAPKQDEAPKVQPPKQEAPKRDQRDSALPTPESADGKYPYIVIYKTGDKIRAGVADGGDVWVLAVPAGHRDIEIRPQKTSVKRIVRVSDYEAIAGASDPATQPSTQPSQPPQKQVEPTRSAQRPAPRSPKAAAQKAEDQPSKRATKQPRTGSAEASAADGTANQR